MKVRKRLFTLLLIMLLSVPAFISNAQVADAVTYQVFYDALSPFGTWLQDADKGYVWIPKAENKFRPYFTNGYWAMTEFGTTWVSGYSWGWAPFHYGRWVFDSFYGWVWIPGLDWGPAWVVWRSNGDYYGWTPLTPGWSISSSFSPNYLVPADWWVFVPAKHLLSAVFQQYAKSEARSNTAMVKSAGVIANTTTINGTNFICGPRAHEFAIATNQRMTIYQLKNSGKAGKAIVSTDEIALYKPLLKQYDSGRKPMPPKSVAAEHAIGKLSALSTGVSAAQPKAEVKKKSTSGHIVAKKKKTPLQPVKKPVN